MQHSSSAVVEDYKKHDFNHKFIILRSSENETPEQTFSIPDTDVSFVFAFTEIFNHNRTSNNLFVDVFLNCSKNHDVSFSSGQLVCRNERDGHSMLLKMFSNKERHFNAPRRETLTNPLLMESVNSDALLSNNTFHLTFSGRIFVRLESSKGAQLEKLYTKLEEIPSFSSGVSTLFYSEKKSDVILQVGDNKLDAHKEILVSRSIVFEAMFNTDSKEIHDGIVVIDDLEPKVVEELLFFMYTGYCPNIKELAEGLLYAAEKYFIEKLKLMCEIELIKKVDIHNVCKLSKLAYTYNAENLTAVTSMYIK